MATLPLGVQAPGEQGLRSLMKPRASLALHTAGAHQHPPGTKAHPPPTQALLLQASGSQQTDVVYGECLLTTCFHVLHFFPIQPCTPITHLLGQGRREDGLRPALPPVSSQPRKLGARSTTPLFPRGPEATETELGGRHRRSPSSQPGPKASSIPLPHAFKKQLNSDLPGLVLLGAG